MTEQERLKKITENIENGINALFESEKFKGYLRVMSRFHQYSGNNQMLIYMQNPDATLVAGFGTWKQQKRYVKKGEKAINIIAPAPRKMTREVRQFDPQTFQPLFNSDGSAVTATEEITIPRYKVVNVFDVSQTEGKELPTIATTLMGEVERYSDCLEALRHVSPVPIEFENILGAANGYYHHLEKRIAVKEGMSEAQTIKTAIHEVAHALLHDRDKSDIPAEEDTQTKSSREVEAESVAYTVCQYFGLDTSDYSFGYIAGWSTGRELPELKASLDIIHDASADIINGIEERLAGREYSKENVLKKNDKEMER